MARGNVRCIHEKGKNTRDALKERKMMREGLTEQEKKKNKGRRTDAVGDCPIWAALLSQQIKCERFELQHVNTQAAK